MTEIDELTFTFNGKKNTDFGLRLIRGVELTNTVKKRAIEMLPGSNKPVIVDEKIIETGKLKFPCTITTDEPLTIFEQSSLIMNWLQEPTDFAPLTFVGDPKYRYFGLNQNTIQLSHILQERGVAAIEFALHPYKFIKEAKTLTRASMGRNEKLVFQFARDQEKLPFHRCYPIIKFNGNSSYYRDYSVYLNGQLILTFNWYGNIIYDTLTQEIKDFWGRPFTGTYKTEFFNGLPNGQDITLEIRNSETGLLTDVSLQLNWGILV